MDIKQIEYEGVEWIHLAQHADQWGTLVNNSNEPLFSTNIGGRS
jgi:hypothetical protein